MLPRPFECEPIRDLATDHLELLSKTMQITFVTDVGESYALEIDPNMEMENIMALLEAEVSARC